jgi:hypothetical protein
MQKASHISRRMIVGLLALVTVFTACNKDIEPAPTRPIPAPTQPNPVAKELVIQFSNTGLPITDVDSTVVVVRDENKNIKKWETLQKSGAAFKLNLSNLTTGSYTAEIYVFTKVAPDNTARQYALTKNINLPLQETVTINSPKGSFNDTWFQRAVFFEGQNDAVAIVAMDPRDAYYGVTFKEAKWKIADLARFSVSERHLVAMKSVSKNINGTIGFEEYWAFTPYVQQMAGKAWSKGYISLYIEHQDGREVFFDYEYSNN